MIVDGLALAFEQQAIRILPDPILKGELLSYEAKKSANGLMSYSAPQGMHDDTVIALALAVHAATRCATPKPIEDFWK